ncbi:fatty acid synthase alpha subunit Lsd1 [Tilletia horrida]|nr:fatty acid synthase alpha subunit Lsd1 [Tilletia horrida]
MSSPQSASPPTSHTTDFVAVDNAHSGASTPATTLSHHSSSYAPTRPLTIGANGVHVKVQVPSYQDGWLASQLLREGFESSYKKTRRSSSSSSPDNAGVPAPPAAAGGKGDDEEGGAAPASTLPNGAEPAHVSLTAAFLGFAARKANEEPDGPIFDCVKALWTFFHSEYLTTAKAGNAVVDIHSVALDTAAFDEHTRTALLCDYYTAFVTLEKAGKAPQLQIPKLLDLAGKQQAGVFALFGGQGTNEVYFNELQLLFDTYRPLVEPLIVTATKTLQSLVEQATIEGYSSFYLPGLDVHAWLTGASARPSVPYLGSIPVSLPLIGLTQLVQYLVSLRASGLSPREFRARFQGATGHSQGIVSAVVLAASHSLESLESNVVKGLGLLFHIGRLGQEAFPAFSIEPAVIGDAMTGGEGVPSPMLAVNGLDEKALNKYISATNAHLDEVDQVGISLYNGTHRYVVTGQPRALCGLVTSLRAVRADPEANQGRVPFSQRKPSFTMRFLPVNLPFHSPYLRGVSDRIATEVYAGAELWSTEELAIEVRDTYDGTDLREHGQEGILRSILRQIFDRPVHWAKATDIGSHISHCVDFGTGGLSGIGGLTAANLQGRGVRVLIPSGMHRDTAEFYHLHKVHREERWSEAFGPRLVKTEDGTLQIDTRFSRLLGRAPIMVPGMTPSTVGAGFNAAVLNAGYHIELAGGGHYNAKALRSKVAQIQAATEPGQGLTLNALFINPRQWAFQLPLWQEMRREGLPLQGFCVAAGIPSTENAKEIIAGLRASGIEHVAFKPSSADAIRQVCSIAAANPDFPIILQWTGGRAGGHHSAEDFHQPILSTYARIRRHANISLVAGSGFGSADDFWPYLSGDWSVKQFGVEPMPFDGVLFGSWVMVAKEAHTSTAVKQLIVDAPGVDDAAWEGTYNKETGGIITVTSELGEPIHKIATRGVKLWAELDKKLFSLNKEKRLTWLAEHRDWLIQRLNADFQKPWFPAHLDGSVANDVAELTYEEVTRRMVRLLYVAHQARWIDPSLQRLMGDWLRRVEERFAGDVESESAAGGRKLSMLQSYSVLDKEPSAFVDRFFVEYTDASKVLLSAEDVAFFLALCQRPGQKPVPFIPVLDDSFQTWFKKDSLWQAEDLDAVFDQDPQRVCVLQGPMAARHATKVDEPIKDMLGGVEQRLIQLLLERLYDGDASKVPTVQYLSREAPLADTAKACETLGIKFTETQDGDRLIRRFVLDSQVPAHDQWLAALAGPNATWLSAVLRKTSVVQTRNYINNPVKRVFAPRAGQTAEVVFAAATMEPVSVRLQGASRSYGAHDANFVAVELRKEPGSKTISVTMSEERRGESIPLALEFVYRPDQPFAPIHEVMEGRNDRIQSFYSQLWFGAADAWKAGAEGGEFKGPVKTLDAAAIKRFCQIVENRNVGYHLHGQAPIDFAIVAGWEAIMQALMASADADLLTLVHLSNQFKMVKGAKPLQVGDVCMATAKTKSIRISDTGKSVAVTGLVLRKEGEAFVPVIEVVSSFFYRGRYQDFETCFDCTQDVYTVQLKTDADVAVLLAKDWVDWTASTKPEPGMKVEFEINSELRFKNSTSFSAVNVQGGIYHRDTKGERIKMAGIEYESDSVSFGNPVVEYVKRLGGSTRGPVPLENGYSINPPSTTSTFIAPASNEAYSMASGDFNPIHINPYFSDFAALPGTITHGMFCSAATRKFVEEIACEGHPERCLSFEANFTGMVLPGDALSVRLRHIAMKSGNKIVKVETVNQRGEKVIEGSAEIAQPPTAFVFTGQGSQEPGMGMDLYNASATSKAIWDEADEHLKSSMGFSILEIVNKNPLSKTVYFGGVKGHAIRERYMSMAYDAVDEQGKAITLPLFPEITNQSQSYTFQSPKGLLYATQFSQISICLVELSAFRDMQDRGFIPEEAAFAGHSLGEYAALAALAGVLQVKELVDVVLYRGLTMQRAVQRDEEGRSNYGMMACNPSRIGPTFTEAALHEVIDTVSRVSNRLLQTVNMNVFNQQYVVAGELVTLLTTTNVLNFIKIKKIDLPELLKQMTPEQVREQLTDIVQEIFKAALEEEAKGPIQLQRGFATIPLAGIDVPFHSRYLTGGVTPFRAYLSKRINVENINPSKLRLRYIPNLVAAPFETTKEYAELIFNQTESARLGKALANWERDGWHTEEKEQQLTALLLIELLAYQFASPVRWIETQDLLFSAPYDFERLVEFGPSPTLVGMAQRTHKLKYAKADLARGKRRVMLCHGKDQEAIYYAFADTEDESSASQESAAPETSAPGPVAAAAAAAAVPTASAPAAAAASVPDEPLKATETIRAILAQKLKKPITEIQLGKAIKDMVGGKSTLQNELIGDLQLEFGSLPERGEEMPLEELGSTLNSGYSGALGKHTTGLVSRVIGAKLPGGFGMSGVKAHLSKAWGLGAGRTDGVLLVALTQEPAKRLASEPEAKSWLDSVVGAYSSLNGLNLQQGGGAGAAGGGAGGAVISSEELDKLRAHDQAHARRQIQILERYLGEDHRTSGRAADSLRQELKEAQGQLDSIGAEHGEVYTKGIMPRFEPLKARHFSSYWNWSRQDAMLAYYAIIHGELTTVDREITARCLTIMNRADQTMIDYMQFYIDRIDPSMGPTYELAKTFGQQLIDNCKEAMTEPAKWKEVHAPTAPHTEIDARGNIVYTEAKRVGVRKLEAYVKEMVVGTRVGPQINVEKAHENIAKLWTLIKNEPSMSKLSKTTLKSLYTEAVRSLGPASARPRITGPRQTRNRRTSANTARPANVDSFGVPDDRQPFLSIQRKVAGKWQTSQKLTSVYFDLLEEMASNGVTFKGQNALLTGVGKGSIGLAIVRGLLSGGARVIITTSSYSRATVEYYQRIYQEVGARGSTLTVVPLNAGSRQDIDSLVNYIYDTMQLDLDFVLPFAAIPENGRQIDGIDDKSELAHRIMLTNVVRLLGAIKTKKAARGIETRPTLVVLPLSPNHGVFGSDGLYSESKISLETLAQRWSSEGWSTYLSITGAVIGWVRGTGLMEQSNIVAESLEKLGLRTFSPVEMAFNILGLLSPVMSSFAQIEPIQADLGGGFDRVPELAEKTTEIRTALRAEAEKRRALALENSADFRVIHGAAAEALHQKVHVQPRSNFRFEQPKIHSVEELKSVAKMDGPIDPTKVVVITGFAEVGPWGSARTRWEQEARGELTIEGIIEMAWMMGMIRHVNGKLKNGKPYVGWVDASSDEPVEDKNMRARYEKDIISHAGVRFIEPELFKGYDPKRKGFQQEIELAHDLEPLEVSGAEAEKYKREHGDKVDMWETAPGSDTWLVVLKKGARVFVPKAVHFDRLVAGQVPTGWSGKRYGIPEEIVSQVDRTTLWVLVCVAEALVMSGISDPYELYEHVHISEVGISIGSGMGGMQSLSAMFRDRRNDMDIQKDILQETFINVASGWVNLLLMSSSGPIKTPVGACATALQSVEIASETILSGKAKVMLAGGFDDFSEEGSVEFANMNATSNAQAELAAGREPSEMSRPTTTTRAGFMESQGSGVQVLMSLATALEMGCPIQAIVAYSSTHTDKQGRSIPAPGHGVMSAALPLQRALAGWGLTADDIGAISMHGTSTAANDKNESHVYHEMFKVIGRSPGHAVPAMAQKWLCGHSKGGAASWALNEVIQSLQSSIIAGNRNADDISPELRNFSYLLYASTSIQRTVQDLNAALLTSFGFGQVGGILLVLHPAHVLARLGADELARYKTKTAKRQGVTYTRMHSALTHGDLVRVKDAPPYPAELEDAVLQNVNARATRSALGAGGSGSWAYKAPLAPMPALVQPASRGKGDVMSPGLGKSAAAKQQEENIGQVMLAGLQGVGVDVEDVAGFPSDNETFLARNFTDAEIAYCRAQPNAQASFCGRFAAKEAVFKAMGVRSLGAAAAMREIEICASETGPKVVLGAEMRARLAAEGGEGEVNFLVSISHADAVAIAVAHKIGA